MLYLCMSLCRLIAHVMCDLEISDQFIFRLEANQTLKKMFFSGVVISTTLLSLLPHARCIYHPGANTVIKKTALYWERQAKKHGPNVCPRESVAAKSIVFDRAWTGGSYCGLSTSVTFQCCQGFAKVTGEPGCPFVKKIPPPVAAATPLSAGLFVSLQESARLSQHPEALTVFAPLDKYLSKWSHLTEHLNRSSRIVSRFLDAPPLLTYSVVEGRVNLKHVGSDALLTTLYNRQKIRINTYPNGLITANCIPVIQGDVQTSQGLLHVLEGPLDSQHIFSIADTIFRDPKLRKFSNYIVQGRYESLLRSEGPLTVFAPTDEAFDRLTHENVHLLREEESAVQALVDQHIVSGVHCSTILHNATLRAHHGPPLRTRCTSSGTFVSGAALLDRDKMATNGVVHVIDRVILPRRSKLLPDLLEDLGLTTAAALLKNSGLSSTLSSGSSFTMFAPSNAAFQALQRHVLSSLMYRPNDAQNLLLNHLVSGRVLVGNLKDNEKLTSKGVRKQMTLKIFKNKVMIENAEIIRADIEGLNGVIHIIDKVVEPPKKTISQLLSSFGNFTRFLSTLRTRNPSLLQRLDSSDSSVTVFAVPDAYIDYWFAYHRWSPDYHSLHSMLENHVVADIFYMKSLPPGASTSVTTLNREELLLERSSNGQRLHAGRSLVLEADTLCTNGVLNVVNRLIQIPNAHYTSRGILVV